MSRLLGTLPDVRVLELGLHQSMVDDFCKEAEPPPQKPGFAPTGRQSRSRQLDILYQNKPLMIEASVAFIVIFLSFLNDPKFFIQGISSEGIEPK